uniref:Uncharacterized protein n=1 Tax=Caenorhabditis japonica TaxID=281687 RepID=A0A8R1EVM8_CAEJA
MSSGAELITRREAREGRLAFWIHKDWLEPLAGPYYHGDVQVSWISPPRHQYRCTDFGRQRVSSTKICRQSSAETSTLL